MLRLGFRLQAEATRARQALFSPLLTVTTSNVCLSNKCRSWTSGYHGGGAPRQTAASEKDEEEREKGEKKEDRSSLSRRKVALLLQQTINGTRREILVREAGFEVVQNNPGNECVGRGNSQSDRDGRDLSHDPRLGSPWLFGPRAQASTFRSWLSEGVTEAFLPRDYPNTVSKGYLQFIGWQGLHITAQSASTVLSSSFLLYAVGLGSGSVPVAGALNWVLKDGLGQLGTLMIVSKRLAHTFDQHNKAWYVLAALQLDVAICLEVCTFSFPTHFLLLGAFANAMKGIAWMASSSTRAVFHLSFAKSSNLADVTAKSVAQSILFNIVGTCLGMGICSAIGQDIKLALASLAMLSSVHLYSCWKATKCVPISRLSLSRLETILRDFPQSRALPEPFDLAQKENFLDQFTLFRRGVKAMDRRGLNRPQGTVEIRTIQEEDCACLATQYFHSNPERLYELLKSHQDARHLVFVHNKHVYLTLHESLFESEKSTDKSGHSLLKAYVHAVMLRNRLAEDSPVSATETETGTTKDGEFALPLSELIRTFPDVLQKLQASGWDVHHPPDLELSLPRARW